LQRLSPGRHATFSALAIASAIRSSVSASVMGAG
jgi:hypothetical protein